MDIFKNKTVRNVVWLLLIILAIAIIGKFAGWWGKDDATKVAVEKTAYSDITETVSASGRIQPEKEVKITPDVPGEIVELTVKEGVKVVKGQLLVKIRPDIFEAGMTRAISNENQAKAQVLNNRQLLAQAEANFKNTQAVFKRTEQLFTEKVVSASEFDKSKADVEGSLANLNALKQSIAAAQFNVASTQASVKEQRDNLRKTTILAPVSGTVSKLNVELGERVVGTSQMSGTEMMRIADLSFMEAQVDVNENDINRVAVGDTANVSIDAFSGRKVKGVVFEIGSSANNATASTSSSADQVTNFIVKIRLLPSSYGKAAPFKPGLSCTVDIETKKSHRIISVPIQAVTTRGDSSVDARRRPEVVFVVRNGKALMVPVKTGIQDDRSIEVSGLKLGEMVITAPYLSVTKTLTNGQRVQVVPKQKLFTPAK